MLMNDQMMMFVVVFLIQALELFVVHWHFHLERIDEYDLMKYLYLMNGSKMVLMLELNVI